MESKIGEDFQRSSDQSRGANWREIDVLNDRIIEREHSPWNAEHHIVVIPLIDHSLLKLSQGSELTKDSSSDMWCSMRQAEPIQCCTGIRHWSLDGNRPYLVVGGREETTLTPQSSLRKSSVFLPWRTTTGQMRPNAKGWSRSIEVRLLQWRETTTNPPRISSDQIWFAIDLCPSSRERRLVPVLH